MQVSHWRSFTQKCQTSRHLPSVRPSDACPSLASLKRRAWRSGPRVWIYRHIIRIIRYLPIYEYTHLQAYTIYTIQAYRAEENCIKVCMYGDTCTYTALNICSNTNMFDYTVSLPDTDSSEFIILCEHWGLQLITRTRQTSLHFYAFISDFWLR